ncbi:MAG: PEP-CTERM sorting domain-containing protein [Candidatus Bathyarchaeota archaeon]|nr:PEP-CTERM sorting domain-containing protein [Candidatus Bathyarchaeota archaeon]
MISAEATTNLLTNGDFETGNLTGWTFFETPLADNIPGYPKIVSFDTSTPGAFSKAARFINGSSVVFTYAGGGIYQKVVLPSETYQLSVSTAVYNPTSWWYSDGEFFELLFDNQVVDSYNYGELAPLTKYRHPLSAVLSVQGGDHQVGIRITWPYKIAVNSPWQHVDDFNLVPEPGTVLLVGLGGLSLVRKRKAVAREMN